MAAILIHTFSYASGPDTITVNVYYDSPTLYATAITTPSVGAPFESVPPFFVAPEQLGAEQGDLFYNECQGTTLLRMVAEYTYPFASADYQFDSVSCGFVPDPDPDPDPEAPPVFCFTTNAEVDHTDESAEGLRDGSITADVSFSGGGTVEYSLDNINWQTSGSFTGLFPGNYQVRARKADNPTCVFTEFVTIAPGASVAIIDYPWQKKLCFFFKLIRDGVEYEIREPIKWDQVTIVGKRDKDWHGWLYQYSDGIIELEFDCEAGKEVIEAEYNAKGSDGEVFFQYGYTYQGTDNILFNAKLNLNTFKRFPGKVSASVERADFNQLFTSRIDAKVKMNSVLTMDEEFVVPPYTYETTLHAKEIFRTYRNEVLLTEYNPDFTISPSEPKWLIPNTDGASVSEIQKAFTYALGVSDSRPDTIDLYNYDIQFAGVYDFNIYFKILYLTGPRPVEYELFVAQLYLNINGVETVLGPSQIVVGDVSGRAEFIISGTANNISLNAGDKVYIYVGLTLDEGPGFGIRGTIRQENTNIVITALEQAPTSQANGWFLHDAMDHAIKVITNNRSELRSKLLSLASFYFPSDGEAALLLATNGKQIRKFNVEENPLNISLKTMLDSVKAIYCVGLGLEKSGSKEVVRVERVGYFYQNKQIIVIEECTGYKEEVAKDLLYNTIEIGYDKYQDSGYNTNDEFNTKREYLTPIKTNKLGLKATSPMITSGYKIEDVRRQQFIETGKDSYSNDDDGFLISMTKVGDTFIPEKDEAFAILTNVISPETVYNARLTPLRMLINWSEWLYNCFHYKEPTDKIKNTYVAQNGKLVTQLEPTDTRPVGDINKAEWREEQDIELSDYLVSDRIFRPEWVSFQCRLTPDKVALINDALMGRSTAAVNYGYVTVKDDKGEYQGVYPYEMEYNFYTEKVTIKGLKKWDSPVDPDAECCNPVHVNGCKLLVNGNELILG